MDTGVPVCFLPSETTQLPLLPRALCLLRLAALKASKGSQSEVLRVDLPQALLSWFFLQDARPGASPQR